MPNYRITGPDGKVYRVTAPEGATKEQVLERVKAQAKPAAPDPMLDPTGSFLDNALAGAGKAFVDLGRGARDIAYDLGAGSAQDRAENDAQIAESRRLDAPLMDTAGGLIGNVAGNVVATLPTIAVPGANTLGGAAAIGGLLGAFQPTTGDDSRLANTGISAAAGAAGQGIANAVGRAARPVQTSLPAPMAALADQAQAAGINLNAAQATGSKPLKVIDSVLDNLPFTADKQAVNKAAQRSAWQRGLLAQVGETADNADPQVLAAARDRIGRQFEEIAARNSIKVGDDFVDALASAESKLTEFSPESARTAIDKGLRLAVRAEKDGAIPGADYQTIRSTLTKAADDAFRGQQSQLGQTLKTIRSGLDDAAMGSISKSDKAAWSEARRQWKVLKRLEKATDPATGAISPKKLINELTRKDAQAMLYGSGDQSLPTLARIGKEFIAEQVPDSGTAQRTFYQNLMTGGGGALGAGTLLGVVPPAALGTAAIGAATPLAMQRALWSEGGKKYLSRGLLAPTARNKAVRGLLRAGTRGGAAGLAASIGASEK